MQQAPEMDSFNLYTQTRIAHWDSVAKNLDRWRGWDGYYHRRLAEIYALHIPQGRRVLEVGCGQGDLLNALKPGNGVGIDFSQTMISRARGKHPGLEFHCMDAHELQLEDSFDYIILSDLLNDLWSVQQVFQKLVPLSRPHTRIFINCYSRLWEYPLALVRKCGLAKPNLTQNWLTTHDIANLLYLSGFEVLQHWAEILCPFACPGLTNLCNRFLVKLFPFRFFALTNFIVARLQPQKEEPSRELPTVSVVIPARNEAGHVKQLFRRIPEMGRRTELIFVEGNSTDDTFQAISREILEWPSKKAKLFKQSGAGKGDAVRMGFEQAVGDILMILDADLTVPPEDLKHFYDAIVARKGEFINGVRLVYPMEREAMRFFNLLGNKFFGQTFSWLLGQPIRDTLCGTKVLWKSDYALIAANRGYFGNLDPFGDFDLLFGAAKLKLKIIDLPIRYRERKYGVTNIRRWSHGWLLLRMALLAALRIKFV